MARCCSANAAANPCEACPACGYAGQRVGNVTVRSMVLEDRAGEVGEQDYRLCPNPTCEVVYFQHGRVFLKSDLRVRVWFKETEEPLPICYCSNLTREQIVRAVEAGNTTIDAVRKVTGATTTGKCLTKNPTGRCCHKVFQEVIDSVLDRIGNPKADVKQPLHCGRKCGGARIHP